MKRFSTSLKYYLNVIIIINAKILLSPLNSVARIHPRFPQCLICLRMHGVTEAFVSALKKAPVTDDLSVWSLFNFLALRRS